MKRKTRKIFLIAALCGFALGAVACGETLTTYEPLFEEIQRTDFTVSYDEENGVISWVAMENVSKYVVTTTNLLNDPEVKETKNSSCQLSLKTGVNIISVLAIDNAGKEVGVGALTIKLEKDFGAPEKPQNLIFDQETNTLSWSPVDGAEKYVVVGDELANDENDFEKVVTGTQFLSDFVFDKGVFVYSVTGIAENDAVGETATLELRSYEDEKFNTLLDDGTYHLIDFSDAQAIEIMCSSDYREWDYGNPKVEIIPYQITDGGYLSITKPTDGRAYFGGVKISFPYPVEIGTLYVDLHRTGGDGCGVMLEDEYGHQTVAIGMEWGTEGFFETANQWATFAFPLDRLHDSQAAFSKVKEITLYARCALAGTFSMDNIRYDKVNVGLMGKEIKYESDLNLLLWDNVPYAKEYSIKIGDDIYTSKTNMLTIEKDMPVGEYVAEITAKNFEHFRKETYKFEVKPETPREISYEENILSYDAVQGADHYYIRAVDANGKLRFESETKKTQLTFKLADGLYQISVSAVKGKIHSEPRVLEYASYKDPNLKKDLGDGTYQLFDFEDDDILFTANKSTYVEWGSSTAANVPYSLLENPNGIVYNSKALVLDNKANSSNVVFGGVTFTLPEAIKFGTLYVDVCRFSGDGCGVMLEDENGNQAAVFGLEVGTNGYEETRSQFATLTVSLYAIRQNNPSFTKLKKITFYVRNARGGVFCFDNVRYDELNLGFLEETGYDENSGRLEWNEVENAKKYEVTIGGTTSTTYNAEYVTDEGFTHGKHNVTIKAINGKMVREKSFVIEIQPSAPDVEFDKTTSTLSWSETLGAEKYEITVQDWKTGATIFTRETNGESTVLSGITTGVYAINVCGVTSDGLKGKTATLVYRTVSDVLLGIGSSLGAGKYNLFDFENTDVLAISKYSDYIDWQWNGSPTLIEIPYAVEGGVLKITQTSSNSQHYGGAYFELENAININSFSFSHKRVSGDGAGVVLVDEEGNKVKLLGYEWSDDSDSDFVKTKGKWEEYTFTIEEILAINPNFGKLKGVHFYAHASRAGEYLFDNVYYS